MGLGMSRDQYGRGYYLRNILSILAMSRTSCSVDLRDRYDQHLPGRAPDLRIKSLSGASSPAFMCVRVAAQTARAYSSELGWTAVNCNQNCNPEALTIIPMKARNLATLMFPVISSRNAAHGAVGQFCEFATRRCVPAHTCAVPEF